MVNRLRLIMFQALFEAGRLQSSSLVCCAVEGGLIDRWSILVSRTGWRPSHENLLCEQTFEMLEVLLIYQTDGLIWTSFCGFHCETWQLITMPSLPCDAKS